MSLVLAKLKQEFPVYREPVEVHPQRAAVLVVLYMRNNKFNVLLIKRARTLKIHAGEISFPGGVFEEKDGDLLTTALRETSEEIGLKVPESGIIARLPMVTTLTEFKVTPFVAMVDNVPELKQNEEEVEEILEAPLAPLLATQHPDSGYNASLEMQVFWHKKHRIWGATANILKQIARLHTF